MSGRYSQVKLTAGRKTAP